jgi:hypothetical protein
MKELFVYNEETYLVDINKAWISTIKEFKKLILRDKDRFKKQAIKEFTFIYHYIDFRSQFRDYIGIDKFKECLRNAELPEDLDIEKDEDLKAAIERYSELRMTKTLNIVKSGMIAIDALASYYKTARVTNGKEAKELTGSLKDLGAVIASTKELDEQLMRELKDDAGIRGSKEKGLTEDPEKNY